MRHLRLIMISICLWITIMAFITTLGSFLVFVGNPSLNWYLLRIGKLWLLMKSLFGYSWATVLEELLLRELPWMQSHNLRNRGGLWSVQLWPSWRNLSLNTHFTSARKEFLLPLRLDYCALEATERFIYCLHPDVVFLLEQDFACFILNQWAS